MKAFDTVIKEKLAEGNHIVETPAKGVVIDDEIDANDEPEGGQVPDNDDYTEEAYDGYLNAELLIPHGDTFIKGRVMK